MGKKILIVDDEPPMRALLRSFFESKDCEVLEAADVEQAIEAAVAESPDAITLDFQMSSYGDGSDVYYELHRDKRTTNIPIVIYSGAGEETVKAAFPLSESLKFVAKPGNLEKLLIVIQDMSD